MNGDCAVSDLDTDALSTASEYKFDIDTPSSTMNPILANTSSNGSTDSIHPWLYVLPFPFNSSWDDWGVCCLKSGHKCSCQIAFQYETDSFAAVIS